MKKQGNNMKKQDAIEKSMNEYQRNEKIKKNQEEKELRNKLKPNLLKRFGSILVDGVLILVVFFGLFFLSYLTILKNGSFQDDMETMLSMKEESHLYKSINGSFVLISDDYDDTLTPEENYDEAITYFYSNIDYCIQENKLEIYNNAKINSKIFTLDENGNYIWAEGIEESSVITFFETQYSNAVSLLTTQSTYIQASNHSLAIFIFDCLGCFLIATAIFYLTIPLCLKDGATIGQKIFKLVLCDINTHKEVTKKQIIIRYFALYAFNYGCMFGIYVLNSNLALLPLLINGFLICFTRNNAGIHEFVSSTFVINKSRSDEFEIIRQLKNQTGQ